jgi:hypothetical protein
MSENSYVQNERGAHQSDPFSERGRKRKQDMDRWIQPCHQSLIAFKNFTKSLLLRSKNVRNGLRILAGVELCGEGMGVEAFSCQPLVLVCGSIEYCGKVIGRRAGCLIVGGHIETRRNWEVRKSRVKIGCGKHSLEDKRSL